ncbi:hypothetical protein [Jeotgalibacillus sp. R-1-5s-1]|uniref:hypothetical protein n=1 Tax=Jeotgalibacillus sp. R-1-5s-1 TaxID=2555897 RepID=UPI00106AFB25|nr:hypothetical protein [Jeotgalibacillus sp. R-1-5s-1]TFD92418.1 hypothetical protein E2491_16690 [Jeotgalibacillus sp. R-1-5s-1]
MKQGPLSNRTEKKVIRFPVNRKPSTHKKKFVFIPIIAAAVCSTLFAVLIFSLTEYPDQAEPVIMLSEPGEAEPAVKQVSETAEIPSIAVWVVQGGVFNEAGTAEEIYRKLAEKGPVIQTIHEEKYALWLFTGAIEQQAKAYAEKVGGEIYIKEVHNPAVMLTLTAEDRQWMEAAFQEITRQLAAPQPFELSLKDYEPVHPSLQTLWTRLTHLEKSDSSTRHQSLLETVKSIWDMKEE